MFEIVKEKEGQVKACPVCGGIELHNCYHDGESITTVFMDVQKARQLLQNRIEDLEKEIAEFRADVERCLQIQQRKENEPS